MKCDSENFVKLNKWVNFLWNSTRFFCFSPFCLIFSFSSSFRFYFFFYFFFNFIWRNRAQMQASQRPQGGNPNASSATLVAHQRALIPSTSIEFPTQRLYAISIFIALQALKLFEACTVNPEQHTYSWFKWLIIDCSYLFALWIVQIPWLQFTVTKTIIYGFILGLLDLAVFRVAIVS